MAGGLNRLFTRGTARSALGALVIFVSASASEAQWLPPLGAAPPGEIAQRLRAEGFVLAGPLYRRNSVYVVDVSAGPEGRERLIVDAWSGEILQRFVTHRGRWRPEFGREFGGPGVFGPPPASDFYAAGPGGAREEPARAKPKPRSAETSRQPARATPAQPENGQTGGGSTPAPAAASSAPPSPAPPPPAAAETAKPAAAAPNAPATASSAAEPERQPPAAPAAEPNSSAPPAPSTASGQEAPKEAATAAATQGAEKPTKDSSVQPAAPSGGAASSPSAAVKQAAPQTAATPQAGSETGKSEKPKGSETAEAESAGAAPPAAARPPVPGAAAKPGRKSRVNDIPVMPLD